MTRALFCGVLLLCACDDAGKDTLAKVKTQYAALLQVGTPAESRDFDPLLKDLDSIPKSSAARGEADQLAKAIRSARGMKVERPLAVPAGPLPDLGAPEVQAKLEQTRAECERLAKELGGKEGDERKQKLELLDACRRRADELVASLEHAHEDGGTH